MDARRRLHAGPVKKSKACQYIKDGQTFTPARYRGWAQFGMWLLRPRVVREFRASTEVREPWRPYFRAVALGRGSRLRQPGLGAVAGARRVGGEPRPWPTHSRLTSPRSTGRIDRWYPVGHDLDPKRPWEMTTNLPVFSLALVRGEAGSRLAGLRPLAAGGPQRRRSRCPSSAN